MACDRCGTLMVAEAIPDETGHSAGRIRYVCPECGHVEEPPTSH